MILGQYSVNSGMFALSLTLLWGTQASLCQFLTVPLCHVNQTCPCCTLLPQFLVGICAH